MTAEAVPEEISADIPFEDFRATLPQRAGEDPPAYLDSLNPAQRQAVEALDGPVLVLAGAGTGKTRVLTTRLAHLIALGRALPWQILAVTFTNKAAREMQERVAALVGAAAERVRLGTFHSLAARILRRHAEAVGLKPNFTILDADDQLRLLKQVLEEERIDTVQWSARLLQAIIERWKDRGLRPDQVEGEELRFADGRAAQLYARYQQRMLALNCTDFGDLLLHNLTLFTGSPDLLADYQQRLRYLLVDEYQDTNLAQYLWLRLLAQRHKNLCCVGDDDQSIYAWRGAEIGNILKFERDFPGASVIRLEQNYRSTGAILAAASHLIAHNSGRLGKTLWTDAPDGEKVQVRGVWEGAAEARLVADHIESLHRRKHMLREIAILVRASFQTREFEERFIALGIPYRVLGGPRFYERQEIRDAVAYLRLVHQPDDDLAFERVVNLPKRGIGQSTLAALHRAARARNMSLAATAQDATPNADIKPASRTALAAFVRLLAGWRKLAEVANHVELATTVLDQSGYLAMWQQDKTPEAPGRLENLKELFAALAQFENLAGFLEHISLVMEMNEDAGTERVSVMTLHSAKGLEFETVFLPGWEEGLFPHQRALKEGGLAGLEEERRLAYVGLTRAKRRVMISYAASRRIYDQWQNCAPSRFIGELPTGHVDAQSEIGTFAPLRAGAAWPAAAAEEVDFEAPARWRDRRPVTPHEAGASTAETSRPAPHRGVAAARRPLAAAPSPPSYAPGERVFHQKRGYGTVVSSEGGNLIVRFEHTGERNVKAGYVEKA